MVQYISTCTHINDTFDGLPDVKSGQAFFRDTLLKNISVTQLCKYFLPRLTKKYASRNLLREPRQKCRLYICRYLILNYLLSGLSNEY